MAHQVKEQALVALLTPAVAEVGDSGCIDDSQVAADFSQRVRHQVHQLDVTLVQHFNPLPDEGGCCHCGS